MNAPLQQRVINILTTPASEWPVIAAEPETVGDLYAKYVAILAAIAPLALLLRGAVRVAVVQYLIGLAATYICARLIAWLGPRFRSSGDPIDGLKVVAYASTASWIAGIGNLVPWVGWLLALAGGFYAVYLFYLGLPPVMKTPPEQVVPFMLVSAILVIVVFTVLGIVLSPLLLAGAVLSM